MFALTTLAVVLIFQITSILIIIPIALGSFVFSLIVVLSVRAGRARKILSSSNISQIIPKAVRNKQDVNEILKMFGESGFAHRNQLAQLPHRLHQTERVYFITCGITARIKKHNDDANLAGKSWGIVFVSNERFFFEDKNSGTIFELPLEDIHAIGSQKNGLDVKGISFCTQMYRVDFNVTHLGFIAGKIKEFFMHAVLNAGGSANRLEDESTILCTLRKIVECYSCAATVIIKDGVLNQCEYCGRHIE